MTTAHSETLRADTCFPLRVRRVMDAARLRSILRLLCGNAKEPLDPSLSAASKEYIRATFSRDFDIEWIREFRFDTAGRPQSPDGLCHVDAAAGERHLSCREPNRQAVSRKS